MGVYYFSDNPNGFVTGRRFSVDEPSVTVMAAGMGGDSLGHWHLATDASSERVMAGPDKPPYRVPTMEEVRAVPWNGLTVASTFAGCGGSSTGYRMAGYRVVWANEFVPAAQDSYRANMAPHTVLDGRDVKLVKPEEVLAACGLKKGELDVFDGSPPCQAFSTAGKRHKGWGTEREYDHGAKQKNEDLFDEYVRLLRGLMPRAFVAENVSGLVKGVAKGYFIDILGALKGCGYRVEARLLDAQWLGVPQARQRIIFVGVREDLGMAPVFPRPLAYRYSMREAIPWLAGSLVAVGNDAFEPKFGQPDVPSPTITAGGPRQSGLVIRQGTGNGHSSMRGQAVDQDAPSPTIITEPVQVRKINHRDVVAGNVAPSIEGYAIEQEWDKLTPGQASDKYMNLVKVSAERPCPTVSASGGAGPGGAPGGVASVTHPTEKRKFTIAELKRICAFPDDFDLRGSYAQQWERLGNSVPPVMMRAVAEVLRDAVLLPARARTAARPPRSQGRSTSAISRKGAAPRPRTPPRAPPPRPRRTPAPGS